MWFPWFLLKRLSARDMCDGMDGRAFWPETGEINYLGSNLLTSWYAGKAGNYTNATTVLWNVWLQDAKYEEKAKTGEGAFRNVIYSRNFTFNTDGGDWWWHPISTCDQTVISCFWTVPDDFKGTGSYVVVAIREAAIATSASTATSGPFTIIASSDPTASVTATLTSSTTGAGASMTSVLPTKTAIASPAVDDSNRIPVGATVGIACAAVVILLGLAGLLWFFCRKRHNKKNPAATAANEAGENNGYAKPELDGQGVVTVKKTGEVDSKLAYVAELDSQQPWGIEIAAAASKAEQNNVRVGETLVAELGSGGLVEGHDGVEGRSELEVK